MEKTTLTIVKAVTGGNGYLNERLEWILPHSGSVGTDGNVGFPSVLRLLAYWLGSY